MSRDEGYLIEETPQGRTLVVTGDWTPSAAEALLRGDADGLTLNYARGYRSADLNFLQDWPVRRLAILARTISDLTPIYRLASSLTALSVETSPRAVIDLPRLPCLVSLRSGWGQVQESIGLVQGLRELFIRSYHEKDLQPLGQHAALATLVMKDRPQIESMAGIEQFPVLSKLGISLAAGLTDVSQLESAPAIGSLQELQLEACRGVDRVNSISSAVNLTFLNLSDCGDIESLQPLLTLGELRELFLYGTTRVIDGDLTPLMLLPRLVELRMKNRGNYRPPVADVEKKIALAQQQ